LKEITIYPPYRPENVKGNMDSKALKHVRKIVSCIKYNLDVVYGGGIENSFNIHVYYHKFMFVGRETHKRPVSGSIASSRSKSG
jgi:hypothetical protein